MSFWYKDRDYPEIKRPIMGEPPEILGVIENNEDLQRIIKAHNDEIDLYEQVLSDKRRLVRELDKALSGEGNEALQASLCDLIEPTNKLRKERNKFKDALEEAIETISFAHDEFVYEWNHGNKLPQFDSAMKYLKEELEFFRKVIDEND